MPSQCAICLRWKAKLNSTHGLDARAGRKKYGGGLGGMVNRAPPGTRPSVRIVNSSHYNTRLDRVVIRVPLKSRGGHVIHTGTELRERLQDRRIDLPTMPAQEDPKDREIARLYSLLKESNETRRKEAEARDRENKALAEKVAFLEQLLAKKNVSRRD